MANHFLHSCTCMNMSIHFGLGQCCGAGFFCWRRSRCKLTGAGLLLCDLGVLRWQNCDNSYNFRQILTIFKFYTYRKKQQVHFKKKVKLSSFFYKTVPYVLCKFVSNIFFLETGAGRMNRSRSRLDRLHNTVQGINYDF